MRALFFGEDLPRPEFANQANLLPLPFPHAHPIGAPQARPVRTVPFAPAGRSPWIDPPQPFQALPAQYERHQRLPYQTRQLRNEAIQRMADVEGEPLARSRRAFQGIEIPRWQYGRFLDAISGTQSWGLGDTVDAFERLNGGPLTYDVIFRERNRLRDRVNTLRQNGHAERADSLSAVLGDYDDMILSYLGSSPEMLPAVDAYSLHIGRQIITDLMASAGPRDGGFADRLQAGARDIAGRPALLRHMHPEARAMLNRIAEGGLIDDGLRILGAYGPSGEYGAWLATATGGLAAFFPPVAPAIIKAGSVAAAIGEGAQWIREARAGDHADHARALSELSPSQLRQATQRALVEQKARRNRIETYGLHAP